MVQNFFLKKETTRGWVKNTQRKRVYMEHLLKHKFIQKENRPPCQDYKNKQKWTSVMGKLHMEMEVFYNHIVAMLEHPQKITKVIKLYAYIGFLLYYLSCTSMKLLNK